MSTSEIKKNFANIEGIFSIPNEPPMLSKVVWGLAY